MTNRSVGNWDDAAADANLAEPARFDLSRSTRHHPALAPGRVQDLLAMEVARSGRTAADRPGIVRTHPADEQGQPVVVRPAHPWRTAEAWVRSRRVDGVQVHDPTPQTAIPDLGDIPAQPCRRHRGD